MEKKINLHHLEKEKNEKTINNNYSMNTTIINVHSFFYIQFSKKKKKKNSKERLCF